MALVARNDLGDGEIDADALLEEDLLDGDAPIASAIPYRGTLLTFALIEYSL